MFFLSFFYHHHHHQSLNREGHWGNTDNFAITVLGNSNTVIPSVQDFTANIDNKIVSLLALSFCLLQEMYTILRLLCRLTHRAHTLTHQILKVL